MPGKIIFNGPETADWFTREVSESFAAVLAKNFVNDPTGPNDGFIAASIDGRPWTDTMWTRDAGVFLRELVHWGYLEHACRTASKLLDLVIRSPLGYRTFPTYFQPNQPGSGSELDGTSAILIAFGLLWDRLDRSDPCARRIADFFTALDSPVEYILNRLDHHPLIPGSGEFGGGIGIEGEFYNVIQNNLVALALGSAQQIYHALGFRDHAYRCSQAVLRLQEGLFKYLRGPDGGWIWAVDTQTLQPDPFILDDIFNQGFGGLNGMLSMPCDVYGMDTRSTPAAPPDPGLITFERLFANPRRKALFEKYGVWTQFDRLYDGYLSSPSYAHGYATQAMLLLDRIQMAGKAADFLARITIEPFPGNHLDRESPFYFYERIYLPELIEAWKDPAARKKGGTPDWIANAFDGEKFDQGCGALNLVNVAEPLKIARLIAGVDNPNPSELKLIPRVPAGWAGFTIRDWPVITPAGHGTMDCLVRCAPDNSRFTAQVRAPLGLTPTMLRAGPFPPQTTAVDVRIGSAAVYSVEVFRSGDSAWAWVALPAAADLSVAVQINL